MKKVILRVFSLVFILSFFLTASQGQNERLSQYGSGKIVYLKKGLEYYISVFQYKKAIGVVDSLLSIDSTHEDKYINLKGELYFKDKDTISALEIYKLGMEKFPRFPFTFSSYAALLLELKDSTCLDYALKAMEKLAQYREIVRTAEQNRSLYIGNNRSAKHNRFLYFDYDSSRIYSNVGACYSFYGKYDSTIYFLKIAHKMHPKSDYLSSMACCYYQLFDIKKAMKFAKQTLELEYLDASAFYLRNEINWYLGKKEKCVKECSDAILHAEVFLKPRKDLIEIRDTVRERNKQSIKEYKCFLYSTRGFYYAKLGNFEKAKSDFGQACQYDSLNRSLYNNRSTLYYSLGDSLNMYADINMSIHIDSNRQSYMPYYNRALYNQSKGQYKAAIEDCKLALRYYKTSSIKVYNIYSTISELYIIEENIEKAKEYVAKAVESGKIFPYPYISRATYYLKLGDKENGMKDLELAEKYNYSGEYTPRILALKKQYGL